jgi:hypothetical protein
MDFPLKYLGISVHKLPKTTLQSLVDRVVDKVLIWKGGLMHRRGRLTLIKTTLSAILVYTSIRIKLPPAHQSFAKNYEGLSTDLNGCGEGWQMSHGLESGSTSPLVGWHWGHRPQVTRHGLTVSLALAPALGSHSPLDECLTTLIC